MATEKHIFLAVNKMQIYCIEKDTFIVAEKIKTPGQAYCLVKNERKEIRVCGEGKMNYYLQYENDLKFEASPNEATCSDPVQNLHYSKRGT